MKKFDLKAKLKKKRPQTVENRPEIQEVVQAIAEAVRDHAVEDFGGQFHVPVVSFLDAIMPTIESTYGFKPLEFLAIVNEE